MSNKKLFSLPIRRWIFEFIIKILSFFPLSRKQGGEKSLVIFKPDGIGDFVLATGCIRLLMGSAKERGIKTTLIVASFVKELAQAEFPDCDVVDIPFAYDSLKYPFWQVLKISRKKFSKLNPASVVSLRHQPTRLQNLLLVWLNDPSVYTLTDCPIGSVYRNKLVKKNRNSQSYPIRHINEIPLELVAHAEIASAIVERRVSPDEIAPCLMSFPASDQGQLVIFPFSRDRRKNYPQERLLAAVAKLKSDLFSEICVSGDPEDNASLEMFANELSALVSYSVKVLAPSTVAGAADLISKARLVIAMDTGPAHIAVVLNKLSVLILGGAHYGYFAPWMKSDRQIWISHKLACFNCDWNCPYPEPLCITEIEKYRITEAIEDLIHTDKLTNHV